MKNVVFTNTVKKEFGTYNIEITEFNLEGISGACFQTFINGKTLLNASESLKAAQELVPGRIWAEEDMSRMIADNPERFAQ